MTESSEDVPEVEPLPVSSFLCVEMDMGVGHVDSEPFLHDYAVDCPRVFARVGLRQENGAREKQVGLDT